MDAQGKWADVGPTAMYVENVQPGLFIKDPKTGKRLLIAVSTEDVRVLEIDGIFGEQITRVDGTLTLPTTLPRALATTPAARDQFARRILAGMEAAIATTQWAPADSIQWRSTEVKLPLYEGSERTGAENRARMADPNVDAGSRLELGAMLVAFADRIDRPLALSGIQIGRVHMLDLPGECLVDYQLFAQRSAPGDFVAVAAYTDLGPGYICSDKAFEEGGYEPTDTAVGPGSESLLKAAILKLLGAK